MRATFRSTSETVTKALLSIQSDAPAVPETTMVVLSTDRATNARTGEQEIINARRIEYNNWDILNPEKEQERQQWDDGMHMPAHAYTGQGTHIYMMDGGPVTAEARRWTDPFHTDPQELVNIDEFTCEELAWIDAAHQALPFWKLVIDDCLATSRPITQVMFHSMCRSLKKWMASRPKAA